MTPERASVLFSFDVAADVTCYRGAMAALDASGNVRPAYTATGLQYVGRFRETVDNSSGGAGDVTATVEKGCYRWNNSANADAITKAEIGDVCYLVDDEAVAKTSAGGTRSPAGVIVDVDTLGVWVQMPTMFGADGDLVAANNLSDLADEATARGNLGLGTIATQDADDVTISGGAVTGITDLAVADGGTGASTAEAARAALGANQMALTLEVVDLVGTNEAVYRVVAPCALTIDAIYSVLEGAALTAGDATLTAKIEDAAVTGGVVTITQDGSAAGDVDSATPSALNVAAAGEVISVTVGGTNDAATATARVTIIGSY
jgi:hypothetical protein